eukprot:5763911-Amphidinium_carterae.1
MARRAPQRFSSICGRKGCGQRQRCGGGVQSKTSKLLPMAGRSKSEACGNSGVALMRCELALCLVHWPNKFGQDEEIIRPLKVCALRAL